MICFRFSLALKAGILRSFISSVCLVLKLYICFDFTLDTLNLPKFDNVTLSPFFKASLITSIIASRQSLQSRFVSLVFSYTSVRNSVLFIQSSVLMLSKKIKFNHLILYLIKALSRLVKILNRHNAKI